MLYYIIRYIIILIIISIIIIIKLLENKRKYGVYFLKKMKPIKTLHKRKKLPHVLCIIVIYLFLNIIIFYPYEGYFIRFNSLEKSIHYSIYDSYFSSISIVEDDDTVFFAKNTKNNITYHSVAKYKNDYGLCDFGIAKGFHIRQESINVPKFDGILTVDYILNKNTNKTCYFIKLLKIFNNDDNDDIAVFDSNGEKLKTLYSDSHHIIFCLLSDKQPEQMDYFTFLGKNYTYV